MDSGRGDRFLTRKLHFVQSHCFSPFALFAAPQVQDELEEINHDVFNEMEQRIKKAEEKERDASAKTDGTTSS